MNQELRQLELQLYDLIESVQPDGNSRRHLDEAKEIELTLSRLINQMQDKREEWFRSVRYTNDRTDNS